MDAVLIIIGVILLLAGLVGCFLPILPGPPISYLALICLQFTSYEPYTSRFLVIYALVVIGVTALDYVVPIYGTKRFGGSKKGVWGSTIGLVVGIIFFPPFGLIIGPFVGALLGELIDGKDSNAALRASFGSFLGFLAGTLAKLIVSLFITYHFVIELI